MKKWILIVDKKALEENRIEFELREIVYEDPQAFEAPDRDAALDHCKIVFNLTLIQFL